MILPASVSAAEKTGDFVIQKVEFSTEESVQAEAAKLPENLGEVTFDTDMSDVIAEISSEEGIAAQSDTYTPDKFESNDTLETATVGKAQRLIRANLHSETDLDCYKFEVTSDDVFNGVDYTFILSDIPVGC